MSETKSWAILWPNKILSMILTLAFVLCVVPFDVFAEAEEATGINEYTVVSGNWSQGGDAIQNKLTSGVTSSVLKKDGNVSSERIYTRMPLGTLQQMNRKSGVLFRAKGISKLNTNA